VLEQSTTGAFSLVKLVRDSRLVHPSAIVAAGPDQFYVLNPSAWWQFGAPSVAYYDGQRMTSVTATKQKRSRRQLRSQRSGTRTPPRSSQVSADRSLTRHELALCESAD